MIRTLLREGCELHYRRENETAALTVVLLHGFGLDGSMWQPQIEPLLEAGYGMINVDIRAHGDSRPAQGFTVAQAAADVDAILRAEGVRRPLLAGLSLGGYVVQQYAADFGGAAGYFTIGAGPIFTPYPRWERAALRHSAAMFRPFGWKLLVNWMISASALDKSWHDELRRMFNRYTRDEFINNWDAGVARCLTERQMRFDAPLFACCGDRDGVGTVKKHLPDYLRYYDNARIGYIEGASHMANLDNPRQINQLLLDFCAANA
ncbi:MAG: alpha/beta hydrolase [Bacillota bacterium]|nr:alpha/beta hydrolase [Bacillota bacterium]